ncbi:MAG: DUF4350 domain-containing protein [Chloroflexaceae bacterium]|nr:DUF4350 domain-containing protein [Chloroflexaceae bacterium]
MRSIKGWFWIVAAALGLLLLLFLLIPPAEQPTSGSTYGRGPRGYGAWYAYMAERGTPLERWEQPLRALMRSQGETGTLLQVSPGLRQVYPSSEEEAWVKAGNRLVILGAYQPATVAPFSSTLVSDFGSLKIETTRRATKVDALLQDRYGAVVWQQNLGKGTIITAVTPDLAANAHQNSRGNFEYLAQLVVPPSGKIWVDEYLHGYKTAETIEAEVAGSVLTYLAKTPVFVVLGQFLVLLLALLWAGNQRFARPQPLAAPAVNNSEAYVAALAEVLQKANCVSFVVKMVGREEQRQLQKALGLGQELVERSLLVSAWARQTGQSAAVLESLVLPNQRSPTNSAAMVAWSRKWEELRDKVTKSSH